MVGTPPDPSGEDRPALREFRVGDEVWLVSAGGEGVAGSDAFAGRAIRVLRFARATEPDRPVVEALSRCLDPFDLFDEELAELLAAGIRVDQDEARVAGRSDPGGGPARGPFVEHPGDSIEAET